MVNALVVMSSGKKMEIEHAVVHSRAIDSKVIGGGVTQFHASNKFH
jgi:hypothetical protein